MPYKDPEVRRAKAREAARRHYLAHRAARNAQAKAWAKANPERAAEINRAWEERNSELAKEYARKADRQRRGILDATGETRNGRCAICLYTGPLVLDHDRRTGLTRGWLCSGCNTGLGKLGDTVEGVQRALDYLIAARRAHRAALGEALPRVDESAPRETALPPMSSGN